MDVVVAAALGVPRADVQRAIAAGEVTVDGLRRPKSFRLGGGETIRAELELDRTVAGGARRRPDPLPGPSTCW